MRYREFEPSLRLRDIVEKYWMLDGPGSSGWECILPDGRAELIFHYGEPFARRAPDARVDIQPRALWVGQITAPACLQPRGKAGVAAIRLRPEATGALGPLAAEMTDQFESLDSLAATGPMLEQLADVASDADRIRVLERFLVAVIRRAPHPEVAFAVTCLIQRRGAVSIEALSDRAGLTRRQLERRFQSDVGLTPKAFARLQRVNRAARLVLAGQSLTDVALACGYFDQAHMTNDFRSLVKQSPQQWQRMAGTLGPLFVGG
jgi:AraC-like DNA-binding protein